MVRLIVCFALFAVVGTLVYAEEPAAQEVPVEVKVVDQIDDYVKKNPGQKLVELQPEPRAVRSRVYTIGRRVSGDALVGYARGTNSYPSLKNAWAVVRFTGKVITHVRVTVLQTSNIGRLYVTAGGINRSYITFVIEAKSTRLFNFRADIYGRR